jgi:hypothetical protein
VVQCRCLPTLRRRVPLYHSALPQPDATRPPARSTALPRRTPTRVGPRQRTRVLGGGEGTRTDTEQDSVHFLRVVLCASAGSKCAGGWARDAVLGPALVHRRLRCVLSFSRGSFIASGAKRPSQTWNTPFSCGTERSPQGDHSLAGEVQWSNHPHTSTPLPPFSSPAVVGRGPAFSFPLQLAAETLVGVLLVRSLPGRTRRGGVCVPSVYLS